MQVGSTLDLGLVTLRSGESTRLDPDLGYLMPGTLQGTLHKNAAPLANAQFHICGEVPGPFAYVDAKTDNAGRFEAQVGAGMYQAVLYGRNGEMNWFPLPSLERATIVASQTTQQDFHVWAGELKVIVRDASGATVPKLQIRVTRAGRNAIDWLRPTDASGATDAELPAEDVMLAVLPKRLQSPVAQHALRQAAGAPGGVDPVEATRMEIARATIVAGKVTTLELRLPPEWEK
jgi:hypothetical protein